MHKEYCVKSSWKAVIWKTKKKMDLGRRLHRLEMYLNGIGLFSSVPGNMKNLFIFYLFVSSLVTICPGRK
jgi:hypothetical protein